MPYIQHVAYITTNSYLTYNFDGGVRTHSTKAHTHRTHNRHTVQPNYVTELHQIYVMTSFLSCA